MSQTVIVGSDHAGWRLKQELLAALAELGFQARDLGTFDSKSVDYPDYAVMVARRVADGDGVGLLVCGTGIGMSIAANKVPGVRAAACSDVYCARMARAHNDANVLCLGARVLGAGAAGEVLRAFLEADFQGGRHTQRLQKVARLEAARPGMGRIEADRRDLCMACRDATSSPGQAKPTPRSTEPAGPLRPLRKSSPRR